PILPPRLAGPPRVYRELGTVLGLVGVAEQRDARNRVQAERMQEPRELWQVADERSPRGRERVAKGHVDHAVEIFDVEDDGVATGGAPAPDQLDASQAPRRPSCQINAANLRVSGHGHRLLDHGLGQEARDRYGVALLE